jgi:arylsulfatase A-like enzyme
LEFIYNFMKILWFSCALLMAVTGLWATSDAPGKDQRHVVVVVWDGMRPDFVTEQNTPTLWKLGQNGVVFRNHHPVYFSATNVNGVALATGMYPGHSGVIANLEFRPQIDDRKPTDVTNAATVRKGDELTHGKYIAAPTVAELVRKAGGRTVIASSKTIGLLHDRSLKVPLINNSATLVAGNPWPNESDNSPAKLLGVFPKGHLERDVWTTRALTEVLWKESLPAFTVLWLDEPDMSQHESEVGSPAALQGMKSSDDHLAAVLAALDQHQARATTDIFVVSDHGFSTIQRRVQLPEILADAGFNVATKFESDARRGDIMLVGGGGSVLFYVVGHEPATMKRLVELLQQTDFAGVIFTSKPMEGAFTFAQGQIDSVDAPDVVMSFRWTDQPNEFGIPGMIYADWQRGTNKGTHATLSRFDMHNTLIASGPDIQKGKVSDVPTGNVDLAPTILQILQVKSASKMDGRSLTEALVNGSLPKPETQTIDASREFPNGKWRQYLRTSRVGRTVYLDEGNGAFEARK